MKALATLLLIVLAASIVSAQDVVPWPLDPADIFAPGVEVVSVELTELPPYPSDATPTLMPTNRCGGEFVFQWQAWVFDSSDNPTHLCNTLTGALSPPLPDGYTWNVGVMYEQDVSASPDGKSVVMLGQSGDYRTLTVLVYDTAAQKFQVIGDFQRQMHLEFREWVTDQILLISTYETGAHNVYSHFIEVIDLRYQSISRQGIDHDDAVIYYPDPPRLITRTGSIYDLHCTKTTYFIETRQIVAEDYGAFCQPEYHNVTTGATYYRILPRTGGADIVRYDPETREQVTLYNGGIEHINWVSPDEHFALLILDDKGGGKGSVAVSPLSASRSDDFFAAHLALVDLTSGEELYRMPAEWHGWAGYWSPSTTSYPENWFFISTGYGNVERLGPNRLIHLDDSGAVTERVMEVGHLDAPMGGGWAYMKNSMEQDWKVDFFNFDSGQIVRLVEMPSQYYVEVEHLHDDIFQVTTAPVDYLDHRRAIYVVRVAGVDIPQEQL